MTEETNPRAVVGGNSPPLREVAKLDIEEQLAPLKPRLDQLLESLGKASCTTPEESGKCADLVKQFKKLKTKIENTRADVKEPYREAADVVQAVPKPWIAQIEEADKVLRGMIQKLADDQRLEAQKKQREEAQRLADERERERLQAKADADAAAAAGVKVPEAQPEPEPEPEPVKPAARAPIATGDYGAAAHAVVRKQVVIDDVYALPPDVLNSPKVHDAIIATVRALRRANPDLEIRGISLVDDHSVQIR